MNSPIFIAGLNLPSGVTFPCIHALILDKGTRRDKASLLTKYFVSYRNMHNVWAVKLLIVDFLYLVNIIGNIFFIDVFLQGEFRKYGLEVVNYLSHEPENRVDTMSVVFPTLTKCTFRRYGPSGTIMQDDALCVLPINIVNQRMYVFLWFWLVILSVITVFNFLFQLLVPFQPVAYAKLQFKTWKKRTLADWKQLDKELHLKFGDWKLLTVIAKNMEPLFFDDFIKELVIKAHGMKNGDIALKPLTRSRTNTLGSQQGVPYKRSGSSLRV